MDERKPKPPPADDPTFLASLSDLDKGLIDEPDPAPAATAPLPPAPPAPFSTAPNHRLTPEAAAALAAASAALAAFDAPAEPGSTAAARAAGTTPLDAFSPAKPDLPGEPGPRPDAPVSAAHPAWGGRVLMIALMFALMLAGAAGAGWIFREPLLRVVSRWL